MSYAKKGHYDGTIFHRVIPGFMIQGGGMSDKMEEKETMAPIKNESSNNLSNQKYTIAMARKQDPNSATCQFFINVADNKNLDKANFQDGFGYAVFGKVVEGMKVVDEIVAVKTKTVPPHRDVPVEPIYIEKVEIKEPAKK